MSFVATYQSNPQFYVSRPQSGSGELVTFSSPVDWDDEATRVLLRPILNAGARSGATGLGQHNRSLDLNLLHKFDTGVWRATGSYSRQDIFTAIGADLGVLRPDGYVAGTSGDVGVTYHPVERATLDIDLTDLRSVYHVEGLRPTYYVDYGYTNGVAQYSWAASERVQWLATVTSGEYKPVQAGTLSTDHSAQVGASMQLTAALSISGTYGRSTVSRANDRGRSSGDVFTGSVTWTAPTDSLALSVKRYRQPGSFGDISLQTDYRGLWTRAVTERLTMMVALNRTTLSDTYVGFELSDRTSTWVEGIATYSFTPTWRGEVHVSYQRSQTGAAILTGPATQASSSGGTLILTRNFGRTRLN